MNLKTVLGGFLVVSLAISCGSSSTSSTTDSNDSEDSGGGGSIALTSVANLPASTDAVTDGSTTNTSVSVRELGSSEVGMPLGLITADDFDANSSHAACEMFNMTKSAINQAAQGDLIQCYITTTFDVFANENDIDIYDGEYHVFALNFEGSSFSEGEDEEEGDSGGPSLIKFKIERDENNVITSFEMFSCGDGDDADVQSMYLLQEISGNDFSMNVINIGTHPNGTFSDDVTVTATLNDEGAFVDELDGESTPKIIQMNHSGTHNREGEGENTFWGVMTFSQSADSATMSGTFGGANQFDGNDCEFTSVLSGSADLIEGNEDDAENYNIGLLELGDGAVKVLNQGSCGQGDQWNETNTDAWDGATAFSLDDPEDSDHFDLVADVSLTAANDPSEEISFGENTYDCDDSQVEATIVFADLDIDVEEACSDLQLGHQHIDCWHIIGDQNQEEGGPEEE